MSKEKIRALKDLSNSPGWEIIKGVMQDEIMALSLRMARTPEMTQQEMDFIRGAIYAADGLANMPDKVLLKLEGEYSLDESIRFGRSTEENLNV